MSPHVGYFCKEMRIIAYSQLLESYKSLQLERVASSFGVSVDFIDNELSRFIASGRLSCKIDKVGGVVETNNTIFCCQVKVFSCIHCPFICCVLLGIFLPFFKRAIGRLYEGCKYLILIFFNSVPKEYVPFHIGPFRHNRGSVEYNQYN